MQRNTAFEPVSIVNIQTRRFVGMTAISIFSNSPPKYTADVGWISVANPDNTLWVIGAWCQRKKTFDYRSSLSYQIHQSSWEMQVTSWKACSPGPLMGLYSYISAINATHHRFHLSYILFFNSCAKILTFFEKYFLPVLKNTVKVISVRTKDNTNSNLCFESKPWALFKG